MYVYTCVLSREEQGRDDTKDPLLAPELSLRAMRRDHTRESEPWSGPVGASCHRPCADVFSEPCWRQCVLLA